MSSKKEPLLGLTLLPLLTPAEDEEDELAEEDEPAEAARPGVPATEYNPPAVPLSAQNRQKSCFSLVSYFDIGLSVWR